MAAIMVAATFGVLLPISGTAASVATKVVNGAIFVLFFLYGARLSTSETIRGLRHWRLHLITLAFTFGVFPAIGWLYGQIAAPGPITSGVIYLCVVSSTIQSSVTFTSVARGNVAGAVVSASISNLIGVFATPALVFALLHRAGGADPSRVVYIVLLILLPFCLGQIAQAVWGRLLGPPDAPSSSWSWLAGIRSLVHRSKTVDRVVIVAVVYLAFSSGTVSGMWTRVDTATLIGLVFGLSALLAFMLVLTWVIPNRLGFNRADSIMIQFCGTKKSLATGAPTAALLFTTDVALLLLPLMVYHMIQLITCSMLAERYGKQVR